MLVWWTSKGEQASACGTVVRETPQLIRQPPYRTISRRLRSLLKAFWAGTDEDRGPAILLQGLVAGEGLKGSSDDFLDFCHGGFSCRRVVGGKVIARRRVIALPASELLLRDVDAKGYLDIELVYRLRQKVSLSSVKQKIARKIQQNESAFYSEELMREALEAL